VKFLIPAAAILVVGAVVYIRKDEAGVSCPSPRTHQEPGIEPVSLSTDKGQEQVPVAPKPIQEKAAQITPVEITPTPKIPNASTQEMGFALRDELALTEQQMERVNAVLETRATELQDCHDSIRKSKIFNPREYGKTLGQMKDGWFRNIDTVLDSRQHGRFQELVADGILRPGTEFLVDLDGMTVIR